MEQTHIKDKFWLEICYFIRCNLWKQQIISSKHRWAALERKVDQLNSLQGKSPS